MDVNYERRLYNTLHVGSITHGPLVSLLSHITLRDLGGPQWRIEQELNIIPFGYLCGLFNSDPFRHIILPLSIKINTDLVGPTDWAEEEEGKEREKEEWRIEWHSSELRDLLRCLTVEECTILYVVGKHSV